MSNATAGHMTVENVQSQPSGFWSAELRLDGQFFAYINYRSTEESVRLDAQEIADRWNQHADLLAFVRQSAMTEVGTISLDCVPPVARQVLHRLGLEA